MQTIQVTRGMSNSTQPPEGDDERPSDDTEHLDAVEDGAGCTEIWETLSEQRDD